MQDCNELLAQYLQPVTVQNGSPLHFVPQQYGRLPFEAQYEPRCFLKGEVQSRSENWHDLLNALVWLTFPAAKAAINARHYQALTRGDLPAAESQHSQRGAVRDMSTLFDESGVVVACAEEELVSLLRDFRWHELFWQRRAQVRKHMGFFIFGHGLYEKCLHPYVGLTGQGLVVPVGTEFFEWPLERQTIYLDDSLAQYLTDPLHCRSTSELTPVPLLGVPGWTTGNESEDYYRDTSYFRTGRRAANMNSR